MEVRATSLNKHSIKHFKYKKLYYQHKTSLLSLTSILELGLTPTNQLGSRCVLPRDLGEDVCSRGADV